MSQVLLKKCYHVSESIGEKQSKVISSFNLGHSKVHSKKMDGSAGQFATLRVWEAGLELAQVPRVPGTRRIFGQ